MVKSRSDSIDAMNPNVSWVDNPATWSFYFFLVFGVRYTLHLVGLANAISWTIVNVIHFGVSAVLVFPRGVHSYALCSPAGHVLCIPLGPGIAGLDVSIPRTVGRTDFLGAAG